MGTINGNSIQSLESLMTSNGVTTSFTYDAWGRMASKNATIGGTARTAYYSYSYGDKLKHVWTNFPGETTTAYNYDGLGKRRVRITDYNGVNPQTTWWRWDLGWSPLCEYADPNLGWEIEGFAQFNVYNGLMHPLAEAAVSGSPANAAYSYLALDHLSSTRAVYNQAKTATASLEFYPYGETFAATGALPDARFTAKSYDPETGLYYFPYRYYSPTASRWIGRDPLGMVDGPNVYGYVRGNPILHLDNYGLSIFINHFWKPTPRTTPLYDLKGCEDADPKTADSGVCIIYNKNDTFMGYGARCVCENAGDSEWDKSVRGCLACAKKKGIPSHKAHYGCYRAASAKHGRIAGIISQADIGARLTHVCFWNCY
jgi:RHS repeat-associated protein